MLDKLLSEMREQAGLEEGNTNTVSLKDTPRWVQKAANMVQSLMGGRIGDIEAFGSQYTISFNRPAGLALNTYQMERLVKFGKEAGRLGISATRAGFDLVVSDSPR